MYFAQWAALFCFAALLAEQLGLNQVWSLTKFVSFYFFWYSNDPEQHENHRFDKPSKCFRNIFNPFNHDSFPMKANRNKISAMIWIKSLRRQKTSKIKRFADFVAEIWSLQNLSLLKVIHTSCSIHIVRFHVDPN